MRVRYTPAALFDLEEIRNYYEYDLENPDASRRILTGLARSVALLKDNPFMGMELRKKTGREVPGRCLISGRYVIVYDVDETISVLRILDARVDYMRVLF